MSSALRWSFCIALFGIVVMTIAQQTPQKRAVDDAPHKIQLADSVISNDRQMRQLKKGRTTPRPLGFFGTVWKLIVDQANDTRSAQSQLSELFSGQFSDSQGPTTKAPIANNATDASTTRAPPRISRAEFLSILRRNLIGLRRLYNLEMREAMADSKKNIQEYKREFNKKIYEQFKD